MSVAVAAFYCFTPLAGLPALRDRLRAELSALNVVGTLLLAPEGLNGTLAGDPEQLAAGLASLGRVAAFRPRMSTHSTLPFRRLKVRLKREIVTLGVPGLDPAKRTGTPVAPADWNAILRDPTIPVIDVRNGFEHAIGSFEGALDPATTSFTDFPHFVATRLDPSRDKTVAMFCTGGIRCEKASALLLERGFDTVYQLDGGILAYLEQVAEPESLWRGGCFVFDERVALGHGLVAQAQPLCARCSMPLEAGHAGDGCRACADAIA
ncbi:rhodanese-like domain-containing protein [Lichenihabitans sp. Uapishka_5]|uniref:oxygen-dependent tRNA uridine(34) hydroxylase TrhO n=1 Tax=Lichenihabitans sp. Uapishka_5 TaxID=3037302 RepID=UPI0029E82931|nr:rhodanese-like domain-containing protein [Lichenihabitans sp. Uapishka_5]MDX7950453.1 rhodanese-like domain-containing protein [Lichenihabitans sp. Uapishka_5]